MTLRIPWLAVALLVSGSVPSCSRPQPTSAPTSQDAGIKTPGASNWVGTWTAGSGKGTIGEVSAGTFKVVNETGNVSVGKLRDGKLECADWSVVGQLSADNKRVEWSNGAVWTRE